MEQLNHALTTVFGLALIATIGYEVNRRRKKLRAFYNVLDAEDKHVVAELDEMVASGLLRPYSPA